MQTDRFFCVASSPFSPAKGERWALSGARSALFRGRSQCRRYFFLFRFVFLAHHLSPSWPMPPLPPPPSNFAPLCVVSYDRRAARPSWNFFLFSLPRRVSVTVILGTSGLVFYPHLNGLDLSCSFFPPWLPMNGLLHVLLCR